MRTRSLSACLLAGLLVSGPTPVLYAQPAGTPPADGKPGSDEASERFRRGVEFHKSGDFTAALVEFKKAYELAPNWRVLFNLGQSSRELNDYASALTAFERYMEEGGKAVPPARAKDVTGWIAELKKKVGILTIETNVEGAEILVDDVSVGVAPLAAPVTVNAGRRRLSATLKGHAPASRSVEVGGMESSTITLELTALETDKSDPPPHRPKQPLVRGTPVGAWVMLSVTGASGIVTGVMGGLALSARGDLDDALSTFPGDSAAIEDAQSRTSTFALGTDIAAGITAAAAITTTVLFIVHFASDPSEPAFDPVPTTSLFVGPTGLTVGGTF